MLYTAGVIASRYSASGCGRREGPAIRRRALPRPTAASRLNASTSRQNSRAGPNQFRSKREMSSRPGQVLATLDTAEIDARSKRLKPPAAGRSAARSTRRARGPTQQRVNACRATARTFTGARRQGFHASGDGRSATVQQAHGRGRHQHPASTYDRAYQHIRQGD
jgi:hypothetical protein